MLASATVSAKDPSNEDLHHTLREDAAKVGEATKEILGDITTKDAALAALRSAAKATAAATSGLIADAKTVARVRSNLPFTPRRLGSQWLTLVPLPFSGCR